jgi:hypothetical protein
LDGFSGWGIVLVALKSSGDQFLPPQYLTLLGDLRSASPTWVFEGMKVVALGQGADGVGRADAQAGGDELRLARSSVRSQP